MREEILEPFKEIRLDFLRDPSCWFPRISGNSGAGIPPQRMMGYYIQGNYHFMPEILDQILSKTLRSRFDHDRRDPVRPGQHQLG